MTTTQQLADNAVTATATFQNLVYRRNELGETGLDQAIADAKAAVSAATAANAAHKSTHGLIPTGPTCHFCGMGHKSDDCR